MLIDKKDELTLARLKNKVVKTDHGMLVLDMDLEFHNNKKQDRLEVLM